MKRLLFALTLASLAALMLGARSSSPPKNKAGETPALQVDFDFTRMNATMRMTQLYRLAANPREFEGKTLRVSGAFLTRTDPNDGKRYFGCLLGNAGGCACCSPGGVLEFEPPHGLEWPKDFPPLESRITVTGRLKMVETGDQSLRQPVFTIPRLVATRLTPQ